jgi:hypothetical protein
MSTLLLKQIIAGAIGTLVVAAWIALWRIVRSEKAERGPAARVDGKAPRSAARAMVEAAPEKPAKRRKGMLAARASSCNILTHCPICRRERVKICPTCKCRVKNLGGVNVAYIGDAPTWDDALRYLGIE